jgi:hypothetical protein
VVLVELGNTSKEIIRCFSITARFRGISSFTPTEYGAIACTIVTIRQRLANKTQAELGSNLGMDGSKVSRIEDGKVTPTLAEAVGLLRALETKRARAYEDYLGVTWRFVSRASFEHPDLENLVRAELGLQKIETLKAMNPTATVLAQAEMHSLGLKRAASYLFDLDHGVAFIGEIGVGKTTALCTLCGLTVDDPEKPIIENVLLEIGAGGTTICEVVIKSGSSYRINVEPYSQEELIQFVDDFCISLTDAKDGAEQADRGVPKEIDRALRNMSGLKRIQTRLRDGQRTKIDPAIDLARKHAPESLRSEVFNLLQVWDRNTTEILHEPDRDGDGRLWIRSVFGEINKGQRKDVGLPKRITLFVPASLMPALPFNVTVVDTRGIDGSPLRPDLKGCLDNPRIINVLCSGFNEAPGPIFEQLIKQVVETGASESVFARCVGLALAHDGEARKMKDDEGFVESVADGYELKIDQARAKLRSWGCDQVPVHVYNANSDPSTLILQFLAAKLEHLRKEQSRTISQIVLELEHLIRDHENTLLSKAQEEVVKRLSIFVSQHRSLEPRTEPVHSRVCNALRSEHPRSVWATIRRQGSWPVLNFYYYLGVGTAIDANRRSVPAVNGLGELVNNMTGDPTLSPAKGFLNQLRENIKAWHAQFIEELTRIGESTFKPALKNATDLWQRCADRYGQGSGYRVDVSESVKDWFEQSRQVELHELLESHVVRSWDEQVIGQLEKVCLLASEKTAASGKLEAA